MTTPTPAPAGLPLAPSEPDDLAQPVSFEARYGAGTDRAIVLGGGGLYFVAWQIAYLNAVAARGVRLDRAGIVVGTSAGSIVSSILTAGHLKRFETEVEVLSRLPALLSALAPASDLHPSQAEAVTRFAAESTWSPERIAGIGHAALAAQAAPAHKIRRGIAAVLRIRSWRSEALQITATDTYTGERLIVRRHHGIPVATAAAASASVPGLFEPQQLLDRRCMDGGVAGSGTHCDRVTGADRALVISLPPGVIGVEGAREHHVERQDAEIDALRASGTEVHHVQAGAVDAADLMDPAKVAHALELGAALGADHADDLRTFWDA